MSSSTCGCPTTTWRCRRRRLTPCSEPLQSTGACEGWASPSLRCLASAVEPVNGGQWQWRRTLAVRLCAQVAARSAVNVQPIRGARAPRHRPVLCPALHELRGNHVPIFPCTPCGVSQLPQTVSCCVAECVDQVVVRPPTVVDSGPSWVCCGTPLTWMK